MRALRPLDFTYSQRNPRYCETVGRSILTTPRKDKEIPLDRGLRVTFSIDVGEHHGSGVAGRH